MFRVHIQFIQHPVAVPDRLDKGIGGDKISDRRIDDVIQTGQCPDHIVDGLEKFQGVHNLPARKGVHIKESLVQCGHLAGVSIPLEQVLGKEIGMLKDRDLEIEPRSRLRVADRLSELGNDNLFRLIDDIGA